MQELKASGVIVIFRIYQESYGNWFWWGITRLSDPGAAYEDIVGQDLYTSSPARDGATPYNNLLQLNKIVVCFSIFFCSFFFFFVPLLLVLMWFRSSRFSFFFKNYF